MAASGTGTRVVNLPACRSQSSTSGKLEKNRQRDIQVQDSLEELGWEYLVIWECQTKDESLLTAMVNDFLAD